MKERAADIASSAARFRHRAPLRVGDLGKRQIVAGLDERRMMKLMPADHGAGGAERAIRAQPRRAIAEVQLALRKAGRMADQAGHAVAGAPPPPQPLAPP